MDGPRTGRVVAAAAVQAYIPAKWTVGATSGALGCSAGQRRQLIISGDYILSQPAWLEQPTIKGQKGRGRKLLHVTHVGSSQRKNGW